MSTAHAFTLIVPELRDARALAAQEFEWRQLGRLAGRGSVQRIWHENDARHAALRPWQHGFLTALGLHGELDRYASAPVSIMGASPTPEPGYWMHAELLHLAAGMDSLTCVPLRSHAAIHARERDELEGSIADHLRSHGLALHANSSAGWMVAFERRLDAATVSPEAAARSDLAEAMPRGRDAGMLRRLMTELQMLLHEHPVNTRRARTDLPAINAVWLWGGGEIATPSAQMQAAVAGEDPYVLGVCRIQGTPCMGLPSDPGELPRDADTVAVIAPVDAQTLEDRWLAPLARSVSQGAWRSLDVMIEGWRLSVSRGSLWRFWRRPRAPVEWVA
jgi:hypothetical protein